MAVGRRRHPRAQRGRADPGDPGRERERGGAGRERDGTFGIVDGYAAIAVDAHAGRRRAIGDDVNLELGRLRARASGSAGGHNGLKSVIAAFGTEEFARLRVGVGRGDARRDLADHVLAKFDPEERTIVAEAVGRAADAAELFVAEGMEPVMNRFNRKEDAE